MNDRIRNPKPDYWLKPLIIPVTTNTVTAMAVHGALCLALCHPHFNGKGKHGHGLSRKMVVEFTKSLGEWLVQAGALTPEQLRSAEKLEEELRKDSVPIPAQASDKDLDRKKIKRKTNSVLPESSAAASQGDRLEPDHHLDVHGGVD